VKHALFQLALALLNPGDEAVIPAPYWVSYPDQVELVGATPVTISTDPHDGFLLSPEALEAAITPKTKLLYLNSPSNPTGATLDVRRLRALAEVLRRHPHVWILSDEIYNAIHFGAGRAPSLLHAAPDLRSRVIVVDGASKSYAMTGWRLGWVLAPKEIAGAVASLQSQSVSNVTSFAQLGLVAALQGDQRTKAEMVRAFQERRDLGLSMLAEIPELSLATPEGAFYFFPDLRAYLDRPGLASFGAGSLGRIAVVPGSAFGSEGFLRFSYTLPKEKLAEGLRRFKDGLAALR
jgi:aspartate aminotransferase